LHDACDVHGHVSQLCVGIEPVLRRSEHRRAASAVDSHARAGKGGTRREHGSCNLYWRATKDLAAKRPARGGMRITYIGHATLLLELGGATILTDPNFDTKLGRILPRVSAPGIALEKLPSLDGILLTHAHADHLSFDSLERLPKEAPLFAPPVIAKWLRR